MADASKRRGCDVCRKRHIKCDRELPSCSQCKRAGWTCPGYPDALSFVNYSQKFPTGRSKPTTSTRSREDRSVKARQSMIADDILASQSPKDKGTSTELVARIQPKAPVRLAPASAIDLIRKQFVWGFEQQALPAKFETLAIEPYLRYIPSYLGHSPALDSAVRFISLASSLPPNQRNLSTNKAPSKELLAAYNATIRSLSQAIGDSKQVKNSGTLAATLLLQLYETWCSHDNPRRALHASAVARLIEHRGPDEFNDEFDIAILEAELANISFSCLREDSGCFLATPQWTALTMNIAKNKYNGPGRYNQAQVEILTAWAYMPGAVRGFHDFARDRTPSPVRSTASPEPAMESNTETSLIITHGSVHTSFIPLAHFISALRFRIRDWESRHLPIKKIVTDAGGGAAMYALVMDVGPATLLALCCYMLATMAPVTDSLPNGSPEELYADAARVMEKVKYWFRRAPEHPFFAAGPVRNSLKLAWIRTREHSQSVVTDTSERIAELLDSVYAR